MQRNHKIRNGIIALVALVVLIGGGVAAYAVLNKPKEAAPKTTVQTGPANPDYKDPEPLLPTIVFTNSGFSQETYNFPANSAIKVHNQSKKNLEFSSDDHPTHKDAPELNMDVLKPGESGTFTPPGKGTYGFHDHINSQYEGTLVIQ